MYDAQNKKGALWSCILYKRKKSSKRTAETSICEEKSDLTDDEKNDLNTFLKTCRLPHNKNAMKEKLAWSVNHRITMIAESFEVYKEMWNFYFVCPDLVCLYV